MSKFKLKLNKVVILVIIGIASSMPQLNSGNDLGVVDSSAEELKALNALIKEPMVLDELEIQRREQVGFALLAEMLEKPFVKTFREYCEELIALWADIPKFRQFCAALQVLKFSKDPKDLQKALAGFNDLFPKALQDRLGGMSILGKIALKKRLTEAMNRK